MKRSDITDEMVVQACRDAYAEGSTERSDMILMRRTGAPEKIVYAAMARAY